MREISVPDDHEVGFPAGCCVQTVEQVLGPCPGREAAEANPVIGPGFVGSGIGDNRRIALLSIVVGEIESRFFLKEKLLP